MKEGCQGVSIAMPRENVFKLDRLRGGSRTHHVNRAVATYLEVQGLARNRYGVDCDYFKRKLGLIMRDIDSYQPDELERAFLQMAETANPTRLEAPHVDDFI